MNNIELIKNWLGSGSINIFGMPMSGKDTVGKELARTLSAAFISSGAILREAERKVYHRPLTSTGFLTPTGIFYQLVLPYFKKPELAGKPLVLSSIGRWDGEESLVMKSLRDAEHETKAVIILNLPEAVAISRRETALKLKDRGMREDDLDPKIFDRRIREYRAKTIPVLNRYRRMALNLEINADQPREKVLTDVLSALSELAKK